MSAGLSEIERQLQQFPVRVLEEFRGASERMQPKLSEAELAAWAQEGMAIAGLPLRSWEAAAEYFRASPRVSEHLPAPQLLEWAQYGSALCHDSPTLAIAFFRASPGSVPHLRGRWLSAWADVGRKLYKGTWKSGAVSARFYEATPELLGTLSFQDLERFAAVVDALSHRSSELAAECLALGQEMLPKLGREGHTLIELAQALAETGWRDVKGCFEGVPKLISNVQEDQRGRFFRLAEQLARGGLSNVSAFLSDGANALGKVEDGSQEQLLEMAEILGPLSSEAVAAFLRTSPAVLKRISMRQFPAWFEAGVRILQENREGSVAFFRIESNRAEDALATISNAVELERVQEVLRMYCRALAGASVSITPTKELVAKNIGWVSEGHAATEGTTVYLPSVVDRYDAKGMNFALFKVVATHQVAHLEFGSFDFSFDTSAARFEDLRLTRENGRGPEAWTETDESSEGAGPEHVTEMGRFFNLFTNRRLALDTFTVVEDGRLDNRTKVDYPGLASAYRRIQLDALGERPNIEEMPVQEAMVEFLLRFSLQQNNGLSCPAAYVEEAKAIAEIAKRLLHADAKVEDSAEATIRIYELIADLPNEGLPQEEWVQIDVDEGELSDGELEELLAELRERPSAWPSQGQEERAYESPPQVDYRGDFKPELAQLLTTLRLQQGQQGEQVGNAELSRELLEQLLASSAELDAESGQFSQELGVFAQNMMREAGVTPPPVPGQGYGPIAHEEEDGRALEVRGPRNYVYDEWDFRALDYKPRWCIVREKPMAEGSSQFFTDTLRNYAHMSARIRRQFELIMPEMFRKIKYLPDGEEYDLDAVIESIIDRWSGAQPSEKVYWRRNKIQRDVAVVFLMDMSASTAEAIDESSRTSDDWDAPDDPVQYMAWLRTRRGERQRRNSKRIIDLEKESTVLLINALETIGDLYGIYGFSGYGRENVEFYVIKDVDEGFSESVKRRIDKITPLHATRMGPAIRHATTKLEGLDARTKLLFLISDGRPQDRGYSREGVEKEYAVHDTKMALTEARRKGVTPFCLTVDKSGHDYLKMMCQDMGYEVLADITTLPSRLPLLYRKLTV